MTTIDHYRRMTVDEYWSAINDYPGSHALFDDHLTDSQAALDHVETMEERIDLLRHKGANREADAIIEDMKLMSRCADERERRDAQYN